MNNDQRDDVIRAVEFHHTVGGYDEHQRSASFCRCSACRLVRTFEENKELRKSRDLIEGAFELANREARLMVIALKEKTEQLEKCNLLRIEAQNPGIDMERVKEERRGRQTS